MSSRPDAKAGTEGFTLVEALVSLLIIALLALALSGFASGSFGSLRRSAALLSDASCTAAFEEAFRAAVLSIGPPYWERSFDLKVSGPSSYALSYCCGLRASELRIESLPGAIRLSGPDGPRIFKGLSLVSASLLRSGGGFARGLELRCRVGGRDCVFDARFGSAPLEYAHE